jgi:hypothetical protein
VPGEKVQLDCFYVGRLSDTKGTVWQYTRPMWPRALPGPSCTPPSAIRAALRGPSQLLHTEWHLKYGRTMTSRKTANIVALATFAGVLLVGLFLVARHGSIDSPKTTTTVTKSAVSARTGQSQVTKQVVTDSNGKTNTTETTVSPNSPESTTTTTVSGGKSFSERVLGDEGLVFLQIGLVLLAAFVAAAAIQRVLVGQYAFKFAGLEIGDLATASAESIEELQSSLTAVQEGAAKDVKKLRVRINRALSESRMHDAALNASLAKITSHLARLEDAKKGRSDD